MVLPQDPGTDVAQAYTAKLYREQQLPALRWVDGFSGSCVRAHKDIHAVYVPEMKVDIAAEARACIAPRGPLPSVALPPS